MKWIGIMLVSSVPAIIGWLRYSQMHRHLDILGKLIAFVQAVHRQVRFKTAPLRDILRELSSSDEMFKFEVVDDENIVDDFLSQLQRLDAPIEAVSFIVKCFDNLQTSDSDSACEELMLCIEQLSQTRDELEQTVKVKASMYLKLGFLAAAFVAVIMI